jgi:hypothetical protein
VSIFVVCGAHVGHALYLYPYGSTCGTILEPPGLAKADLKAIIATKSYSWVSNNPKIWENLPMLQVE